MDEGMKKSEDEHLIDRLSDLPDSLLREILSRLKTREVAQTCILSKRWVKQWAFVRCLNFDSSEWQSEQTGLFTIKFQNFVNKFLLCRDDSTTIDTLQLKCGFELEEGVTVSGSNVETWIRYASKHNTKNLVISLPVDKIMQIPGCLFTSKSIENLELDIFEEEDLKIEPDRIKLLSRTFQLPRLRELILCWIYLDGNLIQNLLCGCPALESLTLGDCNFEMSNDFSLSSQTLKHLSINGQLSCMQAPTKNKFIICTPNVKCLRFSVQVDGDCEIRCRDMSKVREASLSIDFMNDSYDSYLLCGLLGVVDLKLSRQTYLREMLEGELTNRLPTFLHLKKLSVHNNCMICAFDLVSSFLKHCPNLEHLVVFHSSTLCTDAGGHDGQHSWQFGRFFCEHLKTVEVIFEKLIVYAEYIDLLIDLLEQSLNGIKVQLMVEPRIIDGDSEE
ncbi:hypothetical protein LUZ60_009114 [Juncus effusus]|nr:hypothetical protein LUZ60_009114 [Juncus effusus]